MTASATRVIHWMQPPGALSCPQGEIHIWKISIPVDEESLAPFMAILSDDENERMQRFHFARHRLRFIARRAALRLILARYVGIAANQLCFSRNPYGKPELIEAPDGRTQLQFSASHSHKLALVAVTRRAPLGIDIEYMDPRRADRYVARRFFAPGEVAELNRLAGTDWLDGFFNCWTRKESYVKARGQGLSLPLDSFEVSLALGGSIRLLKVHGDPAAVRQWRMRTLTPQAHYAAALTVGGPVRRLQFFRFDPGR